MWWELKRLAKRTRKDKTQGQEDLSQAIRAARADFKTSEHRKTPSVIVLVLYGSATVPHDCYDLLAPRVF